MLQAKMILGCTRLLKILLYGHVVFISAYGLASTYPIIPEDVYTTLERTIAIKTLPAPQAVIRPYQLSLFGKNNASGYGNWSYEAGNKITKRYDIAPDAIKSSTKMQKLLRFFAITDIHITDAESPVQSLYYGYCGNDKKCTDIVGYSDDSFFPPSILYTTQVFDAVVQTINIIHKKDAFDFGISLGDVVDNTQYNELRKYIGILDGNGDDNKGVIHPRSGDRFNNDTYKVVGLDKAIPWYQVIGNHDHFAAGVYVVNDVFRKSLVGRNIIRLPNFFNSKDEYPYMGSIMGLTAEGDMSLTCIGNVNPNTDKCVDQITEDPDRKSLSMSEWVKEFSNTISFPPGHGFTDKNRQDGTAYYSFEPKPGIKYIVLDDTMPTAGLSNVTLYLNGYLDQVQYDWLVQELEKGQAEGKYMIIAAHIPINVMPVDSGYIAWTSISPVSQAKVLATLHKYPNLLMWISGHRHVNAITAQPSPDPAHPELGFWEVETASLRDFPQEFRTFDIYRNDDNTVSIVTISIDPAINSDLKYPAAMSRDYAVAAEQIFNKLFPEIPYYNNAELIKQIGPVTEPIVNNNVSSDDNNTWGVIGAILGIVTTVGGVAWVASPKH